MSSSRSTTKFYVLRKIVFGLNACLLGRALWLTRINRSVEMDICGGHWVCWENQSWIESLSTQHKQPRVWCSSQKLFRCSCVCFFSFVSFNHLVLWLRFALSQILFESCPTLDFKQNSHTNVIHFESFRRKVQYWQHLLPNSCQAEATLSYTCKPPIENVNQRPQIAVWLSRFLCVCLNKLYTADVLYHQDHFRYIELLRRR